METKKYAFADIYRLRTLNLAIGLVISLAVVNLVFNYKTYDKNANLNLAQDDMEEMLDIPDVPITLQPPPPPPTLEQPTIVAVPDEETIQEIEVKFDAEITEDMEVTEQNYTFPDLLTDEAPTEHVDEVFLVVEEYPAPVGGMTAFYKYMSENLIYPAVAMRMGTEGRVYLQFVVDKDGTIKDVTVIKGIGQGCDEEAVRILENAPKWKPGKQRGREVKVRMVLPITFKLARKK